MLTQLAAVMALMGGLSTPVAYEAEIRSASDDVKAVWPVPAELVLAVIRQESDFNPRAVSKAGAVGLMQVMPFNAAKVGLSEADLWDPGKNILAGTRLLAVLLKHYRGDLISALAAYNARPRALFAPLPQNGETPEYVHRVLRFYREYSRPVEPLSVPSDAGTDGAATSQRGLTAHGSRLTASSLRSEGSAR